MPIKWIKKLIAAENFESAGAFDVDGDGVLDIVSGGFWYRGPDFRVKHALGDVPRIGDYYDDFSTIALDVNGDGRMDFVTGGWWGETLRWRENPGPPFADWPTHVIAHVGNVETTRAWDVDGDGQLEIVPNTPNGPLVVYKIKTDGEGRGTGEFTAHTLWAQPQGHGLGWGDVSGSGRGDFVLNKGWLECPADPLHGEWAWHPEFDLGWDASIPVLVADVNGDGLADLIVGGSHSYGLSWWEQRRDVDGARTWTKHPIDPFNSEYHDLHWADIDGRRSARTGDGEAVPGAPERWRSGWLGRRRYLLLQVDRRGVQQAGDLLRAAGRGGGLRNPLRPGRSARDGASGPGRAGQGTALHVFYNEGA